MKANHTRSRSEGSLHQIGVPRSAARVLAACAGAAELCPDLPLSDPMSRVAFEKLGGHLGLFDPGELRATAVRAFAVDALARDFFAREPSGFGVGVWPVLGTRAHRLQDVPWIDVDTPPLAELRRFVLPARRGWLQLGCCACQSAWLDSICRNRRRRALFVLDESVLPLAVEALTGVLDRISRCAPAGSELIIAFDAGAPLRACAPLSKGSALEVVLSGGARREELARYPRLRFVATDEGTRDGDSSFEGMGSALLPRGGGAPALAHLRLI